MELDRLADCLEQKLDMTKLLEIIGPIAAGTGSL